MVGNSCFRQFGWWGVKAALPSRTKNSFSLFSLKAAAPRKKRGGVNRKEDGDQTQLCPVKKADKVHSGGPGKKGWAEGRRSEEPGHTKDDCQYKKMFGFCKGKAGGSFWGGGANTRYSHSHLMKRVNSDTFVEGQSKASSLRLQTFHYLASSDRLETPRGKLHENRSRHSESFGTGQNGNKLHYIGSTTRTLPWKSWGC